MIIRPWSNCWDLGSPLNTVTWFFQIVGPEIRIIDCDSDLDLTPVQRVARMLAKDISTAATFSRMMLKSPRRAVRPF